MNTRDAYNNWSQTYDEVVNKTRDLEAKAIRTVLQDVTLQRSLELGCGTGKNTGWLAEKSGHLTASDFSKEMLDKARQKITQSNVTFIETDLTKPWNFTAADLITCSLVLEHIAGLPFIFQEAASTLNAGGLFYICELHPYRQLRGSRAKFESNGEWHQLEYFVHHLSDFFLAAKKAGFMLTDLREWFDDDDRSEPPRLVSFLFSRP